MTTVTAPSRLHFGLLHLPRAGLTHWPGVDGEPGLPVRHFGGVGLMIDAPGVRVSVEPSAAWEVTGHLRHRAFDFATTFVASLGLDPRTAFRVRVIECPEEHTGLGVGTALALSVAKGIAVETGHADWDSVELARRVSRGERSAIGVHGFQHGGLIVEAGKLPEEPISPLIGKYSFPDEWGLLLCRPATGVNWAGPRERRAFRSLSEQGQSQTAILCQILLTSLLPALHRKDFRQFSEALYEFNFRVGTMFEPVQGGTYASGAVENLIRQLRAFGIRGVGQSSWGSTVFATVIKSEANTSKLQDFLPNVDYFEMVSGSKAGMFFE